MASDREIELVIRAKNLTDEAFKKVQAAIRDVETTSKSTTDKGSTDWKKLFGVIGGGVATGNLLSDAIKKVGGELLSLPNKLVELGARGADVNDVKTAFEGLTTSVGQTSAAMIGQLRTAFGGTVADFDLMKSANEGLSKGVKFTADDMGLLGKAARIMADRVGGDAKQSFDSLISGIADGREKTLKQLPLNFANIEASVKSYADSIDVEVGKLDAAQKQEALRQAVLKESQRLLDESGEVENDFADKVAAGAATVRNWTDSLAQSVAQHGPMIAGLGGMAQAAATLTPLLGMTGLAGAASTLAGVLLSPVGLVVGIGAAAVAFTAWKVSDIHAQADAFEEASKIIGRAARNINEARDIVRAFEAGKAGQKLTGDVSMAMVDAWQKGAAAANQLKDAVTSLHLDGFGPGLTTTKSYAEILKDLRAEIAKLPQATKDEIDAMRIMGKTEDQIHEKTKVSLSLLSVYTQTTKEHTKASKDAAAAAKKYADALHDAFVAKVTDGLENLKNLWPEVTKVSGDALQLLFSPIPTEVTRQWSDWTDRVKEHAATLKTLADLQGGEFKAAQKAVGDTLDTSARSVERLSAAMQKGLDFGSRLSQTILGALQGGGDIGKSVGGFLGDEIGKTLGEKLAKNLAGALGEKFAGALGGMLGPLGAIGGQLLGGLVDKIFGHKGRDMVKEFADKFGGFPDLQKKLADTFDPATANKYWTALTQGVGRNNPQQAKQIIDGITAAIERQDAALNKTPQTFANASAAAEALGLDINKIGDGINGLRVHDSAEAIAAQWQVLKDAGADMDQVAAGAAGKFQVLVDEALKWGHELPESMREPLELMAQQGRLTDAAGNKLEDLSGIHWAEPLEKSVDRIINKFDQLIDRISVGLSGAIRGIPGVDVGVDGGGGAEASHAAGAYIREDHVANVHAGEVIGPMDFMTRALTGAMRSIGSAGEPITIVVQSVLDGQVIARNQIKHMPRAFALAGL